jgi:hypothetical protein
MTRYYVDNNALVNGSGASWDDPFNDARVAIQTSFSSDEVWIKEHDGIELSNVITIQYGVDVYGGFDNSLTGTDGDPNECTGFTKFVSGGGNFRCIVFDGTAGNIVSRLWIHGFVYEGLGGGILVDDTDVTLNDVVITGCRAGVSNQVDGGGIYVRGVGAELEMNRCTVVGNKANHSGGGIFVVDISEKIFLKMNDCDVFGNSCGHLGTGTPYGGGINSDWTQLDRCKIYNNHAIGGEAGGINVTATSATPEKSWIRNSLIAWNEADIDYGAAKILRYVDIIGCTIIDNEAVTGDQTGGVGGNTETTLSNCILRDNRADGGAETRSFVGMPTASVNNCDVEDLASITPTQIGAGCFDTEVIYEAAPRWFDIASSNTSDILEGGDPLLPSYSTTDIHGDTRNVTPCVGADEYIAPSTSSTVPLTADEIIAGLYDDDDVAYWTEERVENVEVITTSPEYWQRIATTLDSIPVTISILWNELDEAFYADIVAADESIELRGVRLSPSMDLLDGLAITELGKLFVIDMQLKHEEPTLEGLGTRFVLLYLPREYAL